MYLFAKGWLLLLPSRHATAPSPTQLASSQRAEPAPRAMKAMVQDRYGSADVLDVVDIATPIIGDHGVLVRTRRRSAYR
jgi:hypothetical protein